METVTRKTRTRLSPKKRKEQLLQHAVEVFSVRGIGRAGHADIAELANVSVATVFNYFPTREDLVDEVLKCVESEFSQIISECVDPDNKTLRESLEHMMSNLIDDAIAQKEWVRVWYEWSTAIRDNVWNQFVMRNQPSFELITRMFEKGIERGEVKSNEKPEFLAQLLQGVTYVIYLQANRHQDKDLLKAQAGTYIEYLCNAKRELA